MKIILWKVSGDIVNDELKVLIRRFEEWTNMGYKILLLHGAGNQINKIVSEKNIPITYKDGQRITTLEVMDIVGDVAYEQQKYIVETANSVSSTVKYFPVKEPIFQGRPLEDYGYVANPVKCDIDKVQDIWSQGGIPVVHFLTETEDGVYNANADLCIRCLAIDYDIARYLTVVGFSLGSKKDTDLLRTINRNLHLNEIEEDMEERLSKGFLLKLQEINYMFRCHDEVPIFTLDKVYLGTNSVNGGLPKTLSDNDGSGVWIRRKEYYNVGLIGSRGFIGSELKKYLDENKFLKCIPYGGSDWEKVNTDDKMNKIDIWISCCPNNVLKENLIKYNIIKPILDVSSDFRHADGWKYSLCYTEKVDNSHHRMSNAGCYSTACNVVLKPLIDDNTKSVHITGISSYSGGGRDFKNKFPSLQNSVLAYEPLRHTQQKEMSGYLKFPVHFVPVVSDQFDRGILNSVQIDSHVEWNIDEVKAKLMNAYMDSKYVVCDFYNPNTFSTNYNSYSEMIYIGNIGISEDKRTLHIQSTIDNILAGGAFSSYLNVCHYLGVEDSRQYQMTVPEIPVDTFENYNKYLQDLKFPLGFHSSVSNVSFYPVELGGKHKKVLQLSSVRSDVLCEWSAVFTKNKVCGHPVTIGRKRLQLNGRLKGIIMNNKISNVGVAGGLEDAEMICEALSKEWKCDKNAIIPLSTGVIGQRLPRDDIIHNIHNVSNGENSVFELATAMMTTDHYPKAYSITLSNGALITGVCKGSGMIEPNMGTMLCVIMTDATIDSETLDYMLHRAVGKSFNNISVDADTSTSDAVVVMSSGLKSDVDMIEFQEALTNLCMKLAEQVVRNGEGVKHVIKVNLQNYDCSSEVVRKIGKNIVNSPLVKCAINANDANLGRIIGAMAREVEIDLEKTNVFIDDLCVYSKGVFLDWNSEKEKKMTEYFKKSQMYADKEKPDFPLTNNTVTITIDLGCENNKVFTVLGGDLTTDYVNINANYRS